MGNLKHGSRKPNVKVNGLVNVKGMKFHDIEGGFGADKKSMLVKEIANIHGRELRVINQAINMNRTRFTDGLDIVDLKGTEFAINLIDSGIYTQNSLNASSNIYLLSERGYSKLLKILEDDFAWEQYDKLVDGYFQMREQVNSGQAKPLTTEEMLELQFKYAKEVKAEVIELKEDFKDLKDNLPLLGVDCDEITSLIKKVCTRVTGYGTPAYKDKSLRGRVYADIYGQVKREFQVKSYKAIKRSQAEKAKEIIRDYKAPTALLDEIIRVNNQINFKDVV
ncbi:ORF6C domain-containing protein [uncultured Clostridium sp.]|uniref:ORF6C domain-containing protein n=1 Tax=uncultured Clostridium sp. TaxID=59620 RepID=UPI000822E746|nr:ORF6C domain-containing protein [uncultured Clostridium sp.]SCJ50401.1 ORF6C domain [uncultured Clostridium sp.]